MKRVILHRDVERIRVQRVVAGDDLQERSRVFHPAGHRPGVVQVPAQGEHSAQADSPPRRLEPDHAAQRGGYADRAAGVGAQRSQAEPGSQRRARAARRASRHALCVPGVAAGAVVRVDVGHPQSDLVHVEFAEQDRPGVEQALHAGRVGFGNVILKEQRTAGGGHAGGPVQVLQRQGDAVQRPAPLASADLGLRQPGLLQGEIRGHRQVAVHQRVDPLDARQVRLGQLHGRDLLASQQSAVFGQG